MKVVRVIEVANEEHNAAVRDVFLGRKVVSCGMVEFPPGHYAHEGEHHVHEHDEVFLILAGEITVPIEGGATDVARAGDWALVEAGEEHHLTNHTNSPCKCIYLVLEQ
jgi:quercetin dioxygenase-like cupin family protein